MTAASTAETVSPGLLKVMEMARRDPQMRFFSLAHRIDEDALRRAFDRLKKQAAAGVDGITKEAYGQELEANLQALHARMKAGQYRHQPVRRVHIPKAPGKTRPIGIMSTEDKIVQSALAEVLGAIYEQDFIEGSYGYRPGRSAHDALRALDRAVYDGEANWILEADLVSYFDRIDRSMLLEMLQTRIADTSLLRLIGKCLHVGVLDGEEFTTPDRGTAQGSALSPMLGNIYLHYALDQWFEHEVKPRLRGRARLIRFADDLVFTFEHRDDAERMMEVLPRRMERYKLTLHPDKTRLIPFARPDQDQRNGKGPATLDLLGFTLYWRRSRKGRWMLAMKTRKARLQRAAQAVRDLCKRQRHEPIAEQCAGLRRRIQGHMNYFGVQGNLRALRWLVWHAERTWWKWLNRRSQRSRLNWERFRDVLRNFPLPKLQIKVCIWRTAS